MPQSIDVNKHLSDTIVYIVKKGLPANADVKFERLVFDFLEFDGDINYHLDQWSPSTVMDTIDTVTETNNTSVPQQTTVIRTEKVTNSYTWSSEHSVSVGISLTSSVKVPFIGGIDTTISTEYSYTSSESKTETKERGWEFHKQLTIPPRSKVTAILMIEKTKPSVPYTMVGAFGGYIRGEGSYTAPGQSGKFSYGFPITSIFAEKPLAGFRNEGAKTYFRTNGVFVANEGIKAIIDVTETPLDNREPARNYIIDVTPELMQTLEVVPAATVG
ncbi:ETX/MTX2 family pore-forming toxin [Nocardia gipuzkoensis]|uniref:ETX/MTX2 family pore-forming toxin n=1 Tax=Nocardia gipuzkoensis TaxID=2749991 RepID=UPI0015EF5414|nr:ETX/MTX2 family pore-forming toxin [Nocardia gipuzkoensis]